MTSLLQNTRRPDVSFYSSGRIDITARIARALGINPGDVINIDTDGNEYILYVCHRAEQLTGQHEAQCYPTKRGKHRNNNYRCHSRQLCRAITREVLAATPAKEGAVLCSVRLPAGNPYFSKRLNTMAVNLITRNPL